MATDVTTDVAIDAATIVLLQKNKDDVMLAAQSARINAASQVGTTILQCLWPLILVCYQEH